jgi:hypothetical protein
MRNCKSKSIELEALLFEHLQPHRQPWGLH